MCQIVIQANEVADFSKVAPYLKDPLVLIGFFLFLGFLFTRGLLTRGIIPPLPATSGFKVLRSLLLYGFIIGILLIFLGFALKYAELRAQEQQAAAELQSQEKQAQIERDIRAKKDKEAQAQDLARQRNTVDLLRVELQDNLKIANELRKNTIVFLNGFNSMAQVLRTPGIQLLDALFPPENIDLRIADAQATGLAGKVFDGLEQTQLQKSQLELQKFTAAANAIAASIKLQLPTIQKLQDADHTRYSFQSQVWQANLPILRTVVVGDVPTFEASYADLTRLRNDYDVVSDHYVDYLQALAQFFDPQKHSIGPDGLHSVLAQERYSLQLITAFADSLTKETKSLRLLDKKLAPTATPTQTADVGSPLFNPPDKR